MKDYKRIVQDTIFGGRPYVWLDNLDKQIFALEVIQLMCDDHGLEMTFDDLDWAEWVTDDYYHDEDDYDSYYEAAE